MNMIYRYQGEGVNLWRSARNVVHRKMKVSLAKNVHNTLLDPTRRLSFKSSSRTIAWAFYIVIQIRENISAKR